MKIQSLMLSSAVGLTLLCGLGCGGSSNPKPSTDAGADSDVTSDTGVQDDGMVPTDDGAMPLPDSGMDTSIEISGKVVDSDGMPVEGASVKTLTSDLEVINIAPTEADGTFTVGAISEEFTYLLVGPTTDNLGTVRALAGVNVDYTIDGNIAVESRAGFTADLANLNPTVAYDDTKGHVVIGWNLADQDDSGHTVTLGAAHAEPYILDHEATPLPIETDTITPPCGVSSNCRPNPQTDEPMYFGNITVGTTTVTLSTGGHNCSTREGVPGNAWPIFADTRTLIIVDCAD